jgi:tetratricopeptide (TPR) repeat protein
MLSTLRRWPEADAQYDLAETLDPLAAVVKFSRGASLTERGSYAAALPYLDAALKLAPGFSEPLSNKVSDLIDLRRFDEATAIVQGMSEPERGMLLSVIAALEDPAQKPAAVKQVMAHARDGILQRPTWLARLGEYELTLSELERLFAQKAPFREYLYSTVQFEPLHQKPRFQALLRQINLPLATTDKGKSG